MNSPDKNKRKYENSYAKPIRICDVTDVSWDNERRTHPERDCPEPFSRAIMDEPVPAHYVAPKIAFTGVEDPESHLTAFNAQMIILGGSDAVRCKMFMGTFTGTTIQWFSGLPDGHISFFAQFSKLF